jgi:hypothetical protein
MARGARPLAVAATLLLCACGGSDPGTGAAATTGRFLPQPDRPQPRGPARRYETAWLTRTTSLRDAPGGHVVKRLRTRTRFGSPAVLAVLGRRAGWLRVGSDALPNGRRGWIRARDADLRGTDYDIRVDRSDRTAVLRHDGHVLMRFRVAVGRAGNETPLGRFAVTDKLRVTAPGSPYGCCAVALTGHQTKLDPGWVGGDRLAIHGTPVPASIGQAVSLGCMRASRAALRRLMRDTPLGMSVVIQA